jgi:hypothetical protein
MGKRESARVSRCCHARQYLPQLLDIRSLGTCALPSLLLHEANAYCVLPNRQVRGRRRWEHLRRSAESQSHGMCPSLAERRHRERDMTPTAWFFEEPPRVPRSGAGPSIAMACSPFVCVKRKALPLSSRPLMLGANSGTFTQLPRPRMLHDSGIRPQPCSDVCRVERAIVFASQ